MQLAHPRTRHAAHTGVSVVPRLAMHMVELVVLMHALVMMMEALAPMHMVLAPVAMIALVVVVLAFLVASVVHVPVQTTALADFRAVVVQVLEHHSYPRYFTAESASFL